MLCARSATTVLNSLINTSVPDGRRVGEIRHHGAGGTNGCYRHGDGGTDGSSGPHRRRPAQRLAGDKLPRRGLPAAILSSIASMGTAAAIGLGAVVGVIGANLFGKRKEWRPG